MRRWTPINLSELDSIILEAVAGGVSSHRIARRLHLSRQAIDYRIKGLMRRFTAVNRAELVSRAFVAGLLDASTWPPRVPADRLDRRVADKREQERCPV